MPNTSVHRGRGPAPVPSKRRTHSVIFKVTEAEWAQLQAAAASVGQHNLADFLRAAVGLPVHLDYLVACRGCPAEQPAGARRGYVSVAQLF